MPTLHIHFPGSLLSTVEREITDEQAARILAIVDTDIDAPRVIELRDATPGQIAESQKWPTGEALIDRAIDGDR